MSERTTTATEKDMYQQAFEREYQTTRKVLHAFPKAKCEIKPSEKMKNARELSWMLVLNQMVVIPTLQGDLQPGSLPQPPQTWDEVLAGFDSAHRETHARLARLDEAQMNRTMTMPIGPGQMGEMRVGDALWLFLNDTIHHRGQLSVFLRLAGGRLPGIYGPTADEPWMPTQNQAH